MKTQLREENERIRRKNHEAAARAYENMNAALNNQADYNGINAVLKFLNEKEKVDTDMPMSEQLKYIEEKLFIKTSYAELDEDWYTTAAVPMLVKTTDEHWLAVIPESNGTCFCIDGGRKIKVTRRNVGRFTKNAVYFYKKLKNGKVTMRDLVSFMIKCSSKKEKITVLAASVLTVAAGMLLPWANSFIFSNVIPAGNVSGIPAAAALIISAVSVAAVMGLLEMLILTNSSLRTNTYVQSAVFSRLLSLKPEFFKHTKSGELSRLILEFSDISKIVSVRSIRACISMVLSLLYLIQIYIFAPRLFGVVIIVTVISRAMMAVVGTLNSRWAREYSKSLSKMSGFCYELFSGIEQVKLCGAEVRMMKRFSERYLDTSRKEDKPFFLKYSTAIYRLFTVFVTAAIFIFGARLEAADYIAFSAAYGAYISASIGAAVIIQMISSFRSSYSLIEPMLDEECEESAGGSKELEAFRGEINMSDLYFRYDENSPYVINGLSAHIREGESVGIVGMSGCGKSTLIRLLLGFEKAEQGSIYIDGIDIRELDLKSFRRKIGVCLNSTGIISGDIYSNITLTKPDAAIEEVNAAVEAAGLAETIAELPMGIHTPINQENCTLSGGQRQRVLIARAILANPSILIFDEATSALDNNTQAKITENLNRLKCTKIIVAHRLSSVRSCDRILVMDKGVIVQEGTFDELRNTDGLLQQLMKRQTAR